MVSADQATAIHSAVFFMDEGRVARQMRATEFGAFLDGYVGLSDLAETDVRAVLVDVGPDLLIRALVFFRIWFDEEGRADLHWNVPIEALAQRGAKGPDLGAGPIRLVCRSQCPDASYSEDLWDPDMTPGSNHFQAIRKAIEANSLKFPKPKAVAEENIPLLSAEAARESAEDEDAEVSGDRARLAQLIREQRLRIKTLQSVHRDAQAEAEREHRFEQQALRNELTELQQRLEHQKLSNEQLKQRLTERNEQYLSLQEQMAAETSAKGRDEASSAAELVLLREQLERRQRELELRDEKIVALEEENHELRHREPVEGSILSHLQAQSVFLVAYHPGVGHLTLPYKDIDSYFSNPVAYAAERCGLNEPAYREWLEHYESPVCTHQGDNGKRCGEPVRRSSQPSEFKPGVDDRCGQHQA